MKSLENDVLLCVRFLGLILILSLCGSCFSQEIGVLDKGRLELQNKPKLLLGFDNNYSLLNDEPVRIMGIRYGFDFWKIKLYEGLYFLQNEIIKNKENLLNPKDTSYQKIRFTYLSTTVEYVFHENKKWEFSIPAKIGFGTGVKNTFLGDSLIKQDNPPFIPAEVSVMVLYKINRWAGISAGLGYRISLYNTNEFDGSFYSFGIKIFLGKLYRTIKPDGN